MKTLRLAQMSFVTLIVAFCTTNCSNGGGGGSTAATYGIVNGQCVQTGTTTVVAMSNCGNNGYTLNAQGICVNSAGQQFPTTYCTQSQYGYGTTGYGYTTGYGGYTTGYGASCYGIYYYGGRAYQCYGYNCSGYALQNQYGQVVQCM